MSNRNNRWVKGLSKDAPQYSQEAGYDFKWYEPGKDNPFGIRILDVRSFTWNVVAMTQDPRVAESFNAQRSTDGREFINAQIEDCAIVRCELVFPHGGDELEGIVFKADSMDIKWDIYSYNSTFLFVRSWTGRLEYRASANFQRDRITIQSIESSRSRIDTAPQTVRFLLATHAMGHVLPHTIPANTPNDPEEIARLSFAMFGKLGCYATYEDTTRIGFID